MPRGKEYSELLFQRQPPSQPYQNKSCKDGKACSEQQGAETVHLKSPFAKQQNIEKDTKKKTQAFSRMQKSDNIYFALRASMTVSTALRLEITSRNFTNNCTAMSETLCHTSKNLTLPSSRLNVATAPSVKGRQLLPAATLM